MSRATGLAARLAIRLGGDSSTSLDSRKREGRLLQELGVRAGVATLILLFALVHPFVQGRIVSWIAVVTLVINGPYYVLAHTGWWPRLQVHLRVLGDVALVTLGLWAAGGLAAANDLSVYMIIPVYAGIVFSSFSCLMATIFATVSYVGIGLAQESGWLAMPRPAPPGAWSVATFNLLMLNVIGGLTAYLAEVYRRSRRRVDSLNRELEGAHEELLKLNTEIQRSARLQSLGQVAAGIAHEIRNAQQVAAGYLQLARDSPHARTGELGRQLAHVEEACATTMRIVRTTLDVARQPALQPEPVALDDLAERALVLKRFDLRRDTIDVRVEAVPGLPLVVTVPAQIQQVLLNLLTNAQEALRGWVGPRAIVMSARSEGGCAVLDVADTGPGFPGETLARVLEPFYTTKADGTGLGLPIAAGIMRDLGGELCVANRGGGGAVISLRLPLQPSADGPEPGRSV
ncbi:MAG: sensor histidine kinase [Gemmatimonadales bacterium]